MWQACRTVFPAARLHGCFFHWSQAIWRKIQEIGLQSVYLREPATKYFIRLILALPFLPLSHVRSTFELLRNSAHTGQLQNLFSYVSHTWLDGDLWEARDWCVFGREVRTNNDVEGFHHRLNHRAQRSNLSFYSLVQLLYEESHLVEINKRFIAAGNFPAYRNRRRRYVQMNNLIRRYWSDLRAGRISPLRLLRKCAALYGYPMRR